MVRMVFFPSFSGSGLMKSKAMVSKQSSGTSRGCRGPVGFDVQFLFRWHSVHDGIYAFSKSWRMLGQ